MSYFTYLDQTTAAQLANEMTEMPWITQVQVIPLSEVSFCLDDVPMPDDAQVYCCVLTWPAGLAIIATSDAWETLKNNHPSVNESTSTVIPLTEQFTGNPFISAEHQQSPLQSPLWYQRLSQILPLMGNEPAAYKGISIHLSGTKPDTSAEQIIIASGPDNFIVASFKWDGQLVEILPQPTIMQALSAAKHKINECIALRRDGNV